MTGDVISPNALELKGSNWQKPIKNYENFRRVTFKARFGRS